MRNCYSSQLVPSKPHTEYYAIAISLSSVCWLILSFCYPCFLGFLSDFSSFIRLPWLIRLRFRFLLWSVCLLGFHSDSSSLSLGFFFGLLCLLSLSSASTFALGSSPRPISIGKIKHHCSYTANLSTLSSSRGLTNFRCGILLLEVGFTLRCLQRLSHPYFASLLCLWQDNSCTRGTSIPVLSY